eukprot:1463962-Rhodomonas_salina.2
MGGPQGGGGGMHPTQHMGQQQQRQQPPPQQQQGMPPHNMMQMSPRTQVLAPLRCRTRSALCAASSSSRSPRCAHPACVLFSGAAAISAPTVADDVAGQCLPNFCFFGVCGGPLGADVLCQQHPSQHPQSQPHMQGMQPQQHPGQPQQQLPPSPALLRAAALARSPSVLLAANSYPHAGCQAGAAAAAAPAPAATAGTATLGHLRY